ncbi:MAG: hypothetical protein ABSC95_17680 [Acetobacteraceae bacterium]|jgi:hypothetical protein
MPRNERTCSEESDIDDVFVNLLGQGLSQAAAIEQMGGKINVDKAHRLKELAEQQGQIVTKLNEEEFPPDRLRAIRELASNAPWVSGLQKRLREESGNVLKEVWVFHAGRTRHPGDELEWARQIRTFYRNATWLVEALLQRSQTGILVAWGKSIKAPIDEMGYRSRMGYAEWKPRRNKLLPVIPAICTPPGMPPTDIEHSATKLAMRLSEIINGTSKECLSLDNGWPVLPPGLDDREREGFLRAHCLGAPGYKAIFGLANDPRREAPLIEAVDTALSGAGQFHNDSFFLQQLEKTGLVSRNELKRLAVGDLGGGLVQSDEARDHPHLNNRFNKVVNQLLGVRLDHYQEIAARAAKGTPNGPAGVILTAINGNKANIVLNCVRKKAVSYLLVDSHLSWEMEVMLGLR